VLNRANARMVIFQKRADYEAFGRLMADAGRRVRMPILAYCLMPNHFHMVLWPVADGDLSEYIGWLTQVHTQRWQKAHDLAGRGHLYQGRFKSFPVQRDGHLYAVCRYVERNPLRAGLVRRAEDWPWSSLRHVTKKGPGPFFPPLADWPIDRPKDWIEFVNRPQTRAELEAVRQSLRRGCPFGETAWQRRTAAALGLSSTLRPRGRPKKR
jgi:putative transposase